MRRPIATLACLAIVGTLGGCVYDAGRPAVVYRNSLEERVIVSVEGSSSDRKLEIPPQQDGILELDDGCTGEAIVVRTTDGDLVGRVEESACPDWLLVINEDGTLDYTEN